MKFYRGIVDLISKPTKTKIFLILVGIGSGIWIYSKFYQYKHGNHSLLGIIISAVPLLIILSLMGDVNGEKQQMVSKTNENSLPMIISEKPHIHNMYDNRKEYLPTQPTPIMIEDMEIEETCNSTLKRIRRVYF